VPRLDAPRWLALRSMLPLPRDWKAVPLLPAFGAWLTDRLKDLGWL
jgi:hypothetical protein